MDIPAKILGVEAEIAEVKGKLANQTASRSSGESNEVLTQLLLSLNQQLVQLYTILARFPASSKFLTLCVFLTGFSMLNPHQSPSRILFINIPIRI